MLYTPAVGGGGYALDTCSRCWVSPKTPIFPKNDFFQSLCAHQIYAFPQVDISPTCLAEKVGLPLGQF